MNAMRFEPPRSDSPEDLLRWARETTEKLNRINNNNDNKEDKKDDKRN